MNSDEAPGALPVCLLDERFAVVDKPAIIGFDGWPSNTIRTGTRWVTLTQLPLAFCAGRSANSLPVPAPMLWTWALKSTPG